MAQRKMIGARTMPWLTGLQAKMTWSYVAVTAAAVVLVEAVVIGLALPSLISGADLTTRVQATAANQANRASFYNAKAGTLPDSTAFPFVTSGSAPAGQAVADDAGGLAIGRVTSHDLQPGASAAVVLVGTDGRVVSSSFPARFPVGSTPRLPYDPRSQTKGTGTISTGGSQVAWAIAPVTTLPIVASKSSGPQPNGSAASPAPSPTPSATGSAGKSTQPLPTAVDVLATVYVQVPTDTAISGSTNNSPALRIGLLALLLVLPVGAVFGSLSTRRLVRRVRRLAGTTARVAEGDLDQRVETSASDELGQLERAFNDMATQLQAAIAAEREAATGERQLADAAARGAERARIARELHDSVSQDLFSLSLLAGGLRRALPPDSPVRPEVEVLERTARTAMREMQALLLELRPVALEDAGLVPALRELCQAYRSRLGVQIDAELDDVSASPSVEHAVLRVAQEALANAVKHAEPEHIALRLSRENGQVLVRVTDDGRGFELDQARERGGLGLRLMRERVEELGGSVDVRSSDGEGTVVSVLIPGGEPE
jgi:signal transduction histidine kinase